MRERSDEDLVKAWADGSMEAFEALYSRYRLVVFIILSVVGPAFIASVIAFQPLFFVDRAGVSEEVAAEMADGALKRSAEGQIVTSEGFPLTPEIVIPEDARSISINPAGEVFAYFVDTSEAQSIGEITLASFTNPKGLEAIGSNLFTETEASGPALVATPGEDGLGTLRQGYLEDSSVDPVREITELIEAQRGYELNAKVISAADQMLGATTQVR